MSETPTSQINTPAEYTDAVVQLLNSAQRTVDVFSPSLTPIVFSSTPLIEAARGFAIRNQYARMRILIRDTTPLTRNDHRFLEIAQRLSSKVEVRKLATDFHRRDDAFVIADETNYAVRRQASYWNGLLDRSRPGVAQQLTTDFSEMWEHSLPAPGVRRLHI